jgi:hypothetical protein
MSGDPGFSQVKRKPLGVLGYAEKAMKSPLAVLVAAVLAASLRAAEPAEAATVSVKYNLIEVTGVIDRATVSEFTAAAISETRPWSLSIRKVVIWLLQWKSAKLSDPAAF